MKRNLPTIQLAKLLGMEISPIKQLFRGSSNALKEHPKTACEIKLVFGNLMEKPLLSGYQSAKLVKKID
jgi:hypothetical protein